MEDRQNGFRGAIFTIGHTSGEIVNKNRDIHILFYRSLNNRSIYTFTIQF